jgi:ABC-type multidrug transport system fused ATPase/permease subunit
LHPTRPITAQEVLGVLASTADRSVRRHLGVALILVVAGGLLAALAPLCLKALVDALAEGGNHAGAAPMDSPLAAAAAYLLALGGARALAELRPLVTGIADQRFHARLTQRFFAHLLDLPLSYLQQRRSGELIHALELAATGCQLVTAHSVGSVLPSLVEIVTVAIVLAHLEQVALVATFAATAAAYLLVFSVGSFRVSRCARAVSNASLELHAMLTDSLLHCETIKCFTAQPAQRQRLQALTDSLEAGWLDLNRVRMRLGMIVAVVFTASVALSLHLAANAVERRTLTIGGFVLATVYMLQMVRPLELLGSAVRDLAQAAGFMRPLLMILRETPEASPRHGPPACDPAPHGAGHKRVDPASTPRRQSPRVQFEGVQFGYDPQRTIFQCLDLDVPAGRSIAIVGASGCGKSSLVRLLLRLYAPQAGRILVDGRPIDSLPIGQLRSWVRLVPQDTALFNDTLAFNIGLGKPGATLAEIERAARLACLDHFISALPAGYHTAVGERGLSLSGGERQRVAIARAVIGDPRVYVFDEATSMLDSRTEAAITGELRSLSSGCTTITIAHRLSTVQDADEIVVLAQGRIAERGRHAELLRRQGLYAQFWHRQHGGTAALDSTA